VDRDGKYSVSFEYLRAILTRYVVPPADVNVLVVSRNGRPKGGLEVLDELRKGSVHVNIYIYGLSAEDTNRNVQEIHDLWARNFRPVYQQKFAVKKAQTITLLADYPNHHIQKRWIRRA